MSYKKNKRYFEKSGLVDPAVSYHVTLENVTNIDGEDIKSMVDRGKYFTIFAPRQSGKTTFFRNFCRTLQKDSTYIPILLSFESNQDFDRLLFYKRIQKKLYEQLLERLFTVACPQSESVKTFLELHNLKNNYTFMELFDHLNKLIRNKKIIIFIDEFDGIPRHELKNFLTSLRELYRKLYQEYKEQRDKALYSVGLVGIRNIAKLVVGGVSPFNIADQISLPSFSLNNIRELYRQYTEETGQPFTMEAVQKVYEESAGQPWLVNRLGTILTCKIKSETIEPITAGDVEQAVAILVDKNNSHFENLYEKALLFKNTFIKILSTDVKYDVNDASQSELIQYGLVRKEGKMVVVANPIYKKRFASLSPDSVIFTSQQEKKIFISYSHDDKKWLNIILKSLSVLKHHGITIWFDDHIMAGKEWKPEIQEAIETSHLTICLISENYLISDFIREREIPEVLKRKKEGMRIIPILLENSSWKLLDWLSEIQMYPKDGVPFEDLTPKDMKNKLIEIVAQIKSFFDQQ
ncbi:Protein containing ATPase domain, prokaryote [Candidatus Magnetomoraceae bacterium gMMP-15]